MRGKAAPILNLDALAALADRAHADGRRLVLTNGAFDLLHVGHLRYLRAAADLGDMLVVAVNSDASVRRAKGPARPIVPDHERAELVAAVVGVDAVTVFADDTVAQVIAAVRPHVHAKGTDYSVASVPEAAQVHALGGRIAIVGDPKAHATSQLIAALAGRGARASTSATKGSS